MKRCLPWILFVPLAGLTGCSAQADPGRRACNEFVDVVVQKMADDCESADRDQVRQSVMTGLRLGGIEGCTDVVRVRDEDAFYGECLPEIESSACSALLDRGVLPNSCQGQLLVEH